MWTSLENPVEIGRDELHELRAGRDEYHQNKIKKTV